MNKYPMVKLGDITSLITKGTTPTTLGYNFQKHGINFIKVECINEYGKFLTDKIEHISIECNDKLKRSQLEINDILFSIAGAIGRIAIVDDAILPANTNQALAIIRLKKNINLNINYFIFTLKSNQTKKQYEKNKQGVVQLNISLKDISNIKIPLPPIEEQHHIATVLDKVTAQIDNCKKILQNLDLLVKSKFVQMFGDPVSNPMGWEENLLNNLGELNRGVSKHRPRNDVSLLNGKYPLIQTGDIAKSNLYIEEYESTYSELGLKQSKMWEKGTLCITIAGNIAKTGILTFNACFPDSVVGFIGNKKVSQIFIHYWFSFFQKILEEQAPQVAQKNINLKILNNLIVITPPIELQNQFAEFVENVEKQKQQAQNTLNQLEILKNALMQKYFD